MLLNLEKHTPFYQFLSKLSEFFLVKDLTNWVLLWPDLGSNFFLLGCIVWQMNDSFQCPLEKVYSLTLVPPMDYLFYPQQTILKNHDQCQLSLKHSKWIWNLRFLLQNVFHAFFGLILLIQLHTPYKKLAPSFFTNDKAKRYIKLHLQYLTRIFPDWLITYLMKLAPLSTQLPKCNGRSTYLWAMFDSLTMCEYTLSRKTY